ncbi:ABC transporter permease, partial [Priestia megaterium]
TWNEYVTWNHSFFPCFLYIFISIFYYTVINNEYNNSTWRVIFITPVARTHIFIVKWLVGNILMLISLIIGTFLVFITALFLQISDISVIKLFYFPLYLWLGAQGMIAIFSMLSIIIKNGVISISIGIVSSLLYLQNSNQKLLPISYPAWVIGPDASYSIHYLVPYMSMSLIVTIFAILMGIFSVNKKDF